MEKNVKQRKKLSVGQIRLVESMLPENNYLKGLDRVSQNQCHVFDDRGFCIRFQKKTVKPLVEAKIIVQSLAAFDKWILDNAFRKSYLYESILKRK
jgi:hypothetical protein